MLPDIIFEDDHLLAVNKPPGINTHSPSPYAMEGLYDWLRCREPRWAGLAIIHRLDKDTSGLILFSKTTLSNRSLTQQFTNRSVRKKYFLLTDREPAENEFTVRTCLMRVGEKYISRPLRERGESAETRFRVIGKIRRDSAVNKNWSLSPGDSFDPGKWIFELSNMASPTLLMAEPLTGRTHQIRVHAAQKGLSILGDTLYGGTQAPRVYLHAAELHFRHPLNGEEKTLRATVNFAEEPHLLRRQLFIEPELTDALRLLNGAGDGWPDWYVERLADFILSQGGQELSVPQKAELERLSKHFFCRGAYHKILRRNIHRTKPSEAIPFLVAGTQAPENFVVRENGLRFELSVREGYSVGLFLDQRDNRKRLLSGYVAPTFDPLFSSCSARPEVLNNFAYTCAFSVCAAKAGARTTSLDLSKKYLEWGKRNFTLNQLDATLHEFIYGDAFDSLKRLGKRGRTFDIVLLDPPTFSQSKKSGVFRVEKDYSRLVTVSLTLLKPGGVLFASTNAAGWPAEEFITCLEKTIRGAGRKILKRHYAPQPPDFPASRAEPAYLKTVWLRIE